MATDRPVVIVMPFRDITGDQDRVEAFGYLMDLYLTWFPDWPLLMPGAGERDVGGAFHRVAELNRAIDGAAEDAVIVYSDPGSFAPDPARYEEAVALAAEAPGLVVPHTRALYLNRQASLELLTAWRRPDEMAARDCDDVVDTGVGNLVVFTRETWRLAGGFDERFPLYGGDDAAFAIACGALAGEQRRLPGVVLHLWHQRLPASIPGTAAYDRQFDLLAQYRDANIQGPDAVRALVESR